MPRGEGEKVDVYFFPLRRITSNDEIEKILKRYGLVAADPYSLAAVNKVYPAFAERYPNGTHWRGADGKWYYIAFSCWSGERYVYVDRNAYGWNGYWWLAGLRKVALGS